MANLKLMMRLGLGVLISAQTAFAGAALSESTSQRLQNSLVMYNWSKMTVPEKRSLVIESIDASLGEILLKKAEENPEQVMAMLNQDAVSPEQRIALYKMALVRYKELNRSMAEAIVKKQIAVDVLEGLENAAMISAGIAALTGGPLGFEAYKLRKGGKPFLFKGRQGSAVVVGTAVAGIFALVMAISSWDGQNRDAQKVAWIDADLNHLKRLQMPIRSIQSVLESQIAAAADEIILGLFEQSAP